MPTDGGLEVAECVWAPQWMSEDVDGLPVCAGLAARKTLSGTSRTGAAAPRGGSPRGG